MADPIRQALERLLAVIKPKYTDPDEIVAVVRAMAAARAALAAEPPAPAVPDEVRVAFTELERRQENLHRFRDLREALAAEPPAPDPREALAARPLLEAVARLGDCIGQHTVGEITAISDRAAAWLRENPPGQPVAIEPRGCPTPGACSCVEAPAPAPADHVPDAGDMVAADGEREELAQWLERIGDDYDDLYRSPSALIRPKLARAAALLRQLPPEGMEAIRYCVEEDGAVIQRTLRGPESWAIRAGSACMSTTGEWDIEPMPSDRTDEWLANHRWPSAAAAWEALQQASRQEVGDE